MNVLEKKSEIISSESIQHEDLKSLFYITTGKLDTNIKAFKEKIIIETGDLIELDKRVNEKLSNHNIVTSIVAVNILIDKNQLIQYGTWDEFQKFDGNRFSEKVKEITMTWDFLVKLPNFIKPQRHSMAVKITSETNFAALFPTLVSGNFSDIDEAEMMMAPVVCQVNFINHLLSDELINIVQKWVTTREVSPEVTKFITFCKKYKRIIAKTIHYTLPLLFALSAYVYLDIYKNKLSVELNNDVFFNVIIWFFLSLVGIFVFYKIGHQIAIISYNALHDYGEHAIFNLTQGDKRKQKEIKNKNKKEFRKFLFSTATSVIIDVLVPVFSYFILKK